MHFLKFAACAALLPLSFAAELTLPSSSLDRDSIVPVTYRTNGQLTGTGSIHLKWTDSLGRTVEQRDIPVTLTDEDTFTFPLDVRRAVAMQNTLQAHFSLKGKNLKGADNREEDAQTSFVARPPHAKWRDYEIIMWQQYPANLQPGLRKLGITGGQYLGRNTTPPEAFLSNNIRWYAENIGTDFYSEYHRYRADRIQNWSFLQAKALLKLEPNSKEPFKRHPSLEDADWRKRIHDRLVDAAKRWSPYRPIFYSLGDESGIADLAAFWDFDFSDQSLAGMRRWLRARYGTLDALNREWETVFPSWDLVTPPTTREAMQRKGDNFAAWADFKEWMDVSFSNALLMGRKAIEEVDPNAYVNIGGGQRPGWGGYDYARITKALTAIEPYDIGSNVEIIRSLNPGIAMVSTGFAKGPWEEQRVWRELFHGHRGLIIWDAEHQYVKPDGTPGERGEAAGKYYNELRGGIGALIISSQPVTEPIAIHYSQASMRTDWMLARRPQGDAWINRGAKTDRTDDDFLRLRESWCDLIEDQGMQYKFVSYDQLENGELAKSGYRTLVLPRSNSLSPGEAGAIREFIARGGTVIADGEPGTFNEHSRRLPASPLADLFGSQQGEVSVRKYGTGKAVSVNAGTVSYLTDRILSKEGPTHKLIGDLLRQDVKPFYGLAGSNGDAPVGVELHAFANGGVTVLTLLSNPLQRVDELGPPDFRSNERFEKPQTVTLKLPAPAFLYDVRTGAALGQKQSIQVTVGPYEPVIVAASPIALPALHIAAPASVARGGDATFGISQAGTPAETHVVHVDVIDPSGAKHPYYSGNVLAKNGNASKRIPFAVSDAPGEWTLQFHDLLSGARQTVKLALQ